MSKLSLPKEKTSSYGITLGSRDSVAGEGICRGVRLQLQGIDIVVDFFPLKLGSSDVILRVLWLESLGTIYSNWRSHNEIENGREYYYIKRGSILRDKSQVSLKSTAKTLYQARMGVFVELSHVSATTPNEQEVPTSLKSVIKQFEEVFSLQQGLPPVHSNEHKITVMSRRCQLL